MVYAADLDRVTWIVWRLTFVETTMKIDQWLVALLLILWLAMPALAARPNVVLFVTDDQSPDAGCYGNSVIQTPNLDALAADGTCFDEAFCTTASCSASRSVILTGLYNHANAQYGHQHTYHHFRTYDRIQSLPVLIGKAGYRTARIGKYTSVQRKFTNSTTR